MKTKKINNVSKNRFFELYNDLKTKKDQKIIRNKIINECKIHQQTFYSWMKKNEIPEIYCKILNNIIK